MNCRILSITLDRYMVLSTHKPFSFVLTMVAGLIAIVNNYGLTDLKLTDSSSDPMTN